MNVAVKADVESSHDSNDECSSIVVDDDAESQVTQEEWFFWRELAMLSDKSGEEQQGEDTGSECSDGVEDEVCFEAVKADSFQKSTGSLKGDDQSVGMEHGEPPVRLKRRRSCSLPSVVSCSGDGPPVRRRKSFHIGGGLLVFGSSEHVDLRGALWTEALEESRKIDGVQTSVEHR
jgi:hypothetical protein